MSETPNLRDTFDTRSESYDEARPDYPSELFSDLLSLVDLPDDPLILEIGSASGKATRPLARRGFRMIALELGANLAAQAFRDLAVYPKVEIINSSFEEWECSDETFDLIYAANSWHWLNPDLRYDKTARLLRGGGSLAFWEASHAFPTGFDPFFEEIQDVYDEIGESKGEAWPPPTPDRVSYSADEIHATGWFDRVDVRRYVWELEYTADEYIRLLETFSGHIAMPEESRNTLYTAIRERIAERPGSRIKRHWQSTLHVARRVSPHS